MTQRKHVVIGAGIIGLYTTYSLLQKGVSPNEITIIAEYLPGDQSTSYTSPWAGGNFSCISPGDAGTIKNDRFTYENLGNIQALLGGPSCGLDNKPTAEYWDFPPPAAKIESYKEYLKGLRILQQSELPKGAVYGISYTTWNFNCPDFLFKFANYFTEQGVEIIREKLSHISQAFLHGTKVVFNCSGIGAHDLGGVKDDKVYPTRGQVVVIKAPHIQENCLRWGKDYATYVIPRPFSKDQVVLGGFIQKDNWTGDTFGEETKDIIKRTTELLPKILDKELEIIRVAAGLRPSRHGGVRIEKEVLEEGKVLIHNYGASGYGYQSGLGMAHEAVCLAYKSDIKL